ncbi:hypothetical protein [Streptomyces sp. NPDC051162]|uniref:hypothetical protein n=1 Tax=unclassified Streptomyces TaxID=2593676 RepID=UPI003428E6F3
MKKIIVPLSMLCAVLAVGAAAFFFLFGAESGSAKPSELVGSWRGSEGAELDLHEDGSLTAAKVPTDFSVDGKPMRPFTGKGTWELGKKSKFEDQQIDVTLGEVFGSLTGLHMYIKGKGAQGGIAIRISEDTLQEFPFKRAH